jgi:hypothetical protein
MENQNLNSCTNEIFQFRTNYLGIKNNMPLSEIKDHISKDARKRLMHNWCFTNRAVHNATIAAINSYNELPKKDKHHEAMQDILISHGNYLYSLVHWNTKKHELLVDCFMNESSGKRLPTTLLDLPMHGAIGTGIFANLSKCKTNNHSKKD